MGKIINNKEGKNKDMDKLMMSFFQNEYYSVNINKSAVVEKSQGPKFCKNGEISRKSKNSAILDASKKEILNSLDNFLQNIKTDSNKNGKKQGNQINDSFENSDGENELEDSLNLSQIMEELQ